MYIKIILLVSERIIQGNWAIFNPKMMCHNSGSAVTISLKFCRMDGTKKYLKITFVFPKKFIKAKRALWAPKQHMVITVSPL